MKTTLKVLALFTMIAIPAAIAVEAAGVILPPSLSAVSTIGMFVATLIALTAVSDYTRVRKLYVVGSLVETKAAHPLAA